MTHDGGPMVVASVSPQHDVCARARAAAVAIAVVPHGVVLTFAGARPWLVPDLTAPPSWFDVLSVVAGSLAVVVGLYLLGRGVAAAWRDVSPLPRGDRAARRAWAALTAAAVALGCVLPATLVFSTVWTVISVALVLHVIGWEPRGASAPALDGWRRRRLAWTLGIVVLSHVLAWSITLAHARVVTDEDFARVDAIRAGTVVRTEYEDWPVDTYNLMMSGTVVAGRSVLGDMSMTQFTLGYWPLWAHLLVVPEGEPSPTRRESFVMAAVALAMSLAAWSAGLGAVAWWPVGWGRLALHAAAKDGPVSRPPDRA